MYPDTSKNGHYYQIQSNYDINSHSRKYGQNNGSSNHHIDPTYHRNANRRDNNGSNGYCQHNDNKDIDRRNRKNDTNRDRGHHGYHGDYQTNRHRDYKRRRNHSDHDSNNGNNQHDRFSYGSNGHREHKDEYSKESNKNRSGRRKNKNDSNGDRGHHGHHVDSNSKGGCINDNTSKNGKRRGRHKHKIRNDNAIYGDSSLERHPRRFKTRGKDRQNKGAHRKYPTSMLF